MAASSQSPVPNQADLTAQSLFVVFRQLPQQTQQAFVKLLKESEQNYVNDEWVPFSEPSLDAIWNTPEEDHWDALYAKHHAK